MTAELTGDLILAGSFLLGSGLIAHAVTTGSRRISDATDRLVGRAEDIGKFVHRIAISSEVMVNDQPVQQENARLKAANQNLSGAALSVIEGEAPVDEATMRPDVVTGVGIGWEKAQGIMSEGLRARAGS